MHVTVKRGASARLSARGTSVRKEHGALIANALMHLVNDGCFVAIYPVLPLMAKEFHLSYTQVGFLKTALSASSTALQLPVAMLAERFGDVTFLALGMAWVAAGLMAMTKGWGILSPTTFASLLSIGVLDGSVRNALLTFVPFLLMAKGVSEVSASLMLTVIFAGGAVGKLGCGILADRLGTTAMIVLTEGLTELCLLALLPLDQMLLLPLLFCLGFFLNGTSSVLLDGVADLFDSTKRSRGYGLYFTLYLGSGALSPSLYGFVGDSLGLHSVCIAMALASLAIVPLAGLYHLSCRRPGQV